MKKKRMRITYVSVPTLGFRVYVIIGNDFRESVKKMKLGLPEDGIKQDALAMTCHKGRHSYIFLRHDTTVGEIAHETWHVIYRQFNRIGADFENEIVAYHLDYLVGMIYDYVKRAEK